MTVIHQTGVIHTDLKPDNFVLVDDGVVTVREMDVHGVFQDRVSHPQESIICAYIPFRSY